MSYPKHFAKGQIVRFHYNGKYRIGRVDRMVHSNCVTMQMLNSFGHSFPIPSGGFKSFTISKMEKILD